MTQFFFPYLWFDFDKLDQFLSMPIFFLAHILNIFCQCDDVEDKNVASTALALLFPLSHPWRNENHCMRVWTRFYTKWLLMDFVCTEEKKLFHSWVEESIENILLSQN